MSYNVEAEAGLLIDELEKLTSSERVIRMVKLGALHRTTPNAKTLIDHLATKSLYEQLLSLESCHGSRDLSFAKHIMSSSSSKHLKKRATDMIALFGSDEELLEAIGNVPPYLQVATLRRMRHARGHRKRLAVIEKYLVELEKEERNVKDFQRLFLLGSAALVEKNIPRFLDRFSNQQWLDLAKYHPKIAHRLLYEWIEGSVEDDRNLIAKINTVINQWLSHDYSVDFAVELFRPALKKVSISQLPITQLLEKSPAKAAQIILNCEENLTNDTIEEFDWRALRKLPMAFFQPLFERYPRIVEEYEFYRFKPEQRLLVWQKYRLGWRNDDGSVDADVVAALPSKERIAESRRVLKLRKFETSPSDRIPYIALLPWDEAMMLQTPFIRSGDVQIRSAAINAQVDAAKFDETRMEDALNLVLSRKNEQDPVQEEMISTLYLISSRKWKENHLIILDEIITNRLKSRDMSIVTTRSMLNVLSKIISVHHTWAAAQIGRIMRDHEYYAFNINLSGQTPFKDCVASIQKGLSPLIAKILRKKDSDSLVRLKSLFEQHTKYWIEYLDACEAMIQIRDINKWSLSELLEIIGEFRPKSLDWLLLMVYEDAKFACHPIVVSQVHRRHQNLLDRYLNEKFEGFAERRHALKDLKGGFWRWTASQQEGLQEILIKDIGHEDITVEDKVKCAQQLSHLHLVDQEPLFDLANNEESAVQEAALRALGDLDSNQGLPFLIEALSDERARIGIYALRKVLKTIPKDKTLKILSSIPDNRVTVAKETTRLIGELGTEEAFQYLLIKSQLLLHADILAALYRALWTYLDREETWKVLMSAAEDTRPRVAKSVCDIPEDGLNSHQIRQLLQLMLRLLNHEAAEVRAAALDRLDAKPLQDQEDILAPRLFELIHSDLDEESKKAAKAIFESYARYNVAKIGDVYRKLLSDRATLKLVHDTYMDIVSPYPGRKYLRPVTHLLLSIFKTDRLSITRRINLMFSGLPWVELRPYIFEIIPELHADALHAAEAFIETNSTGWKEPGDDLLKVELGLKSSSDERARRLALAFLVGGVDESRGWTDEERFRLDGYREDESVLVAEAAWEVDVPEEVVEDSEDEDEGEDDVSGDDSGIEGKGGEDTIMEDSS